MKKLGYIVLLVGLGFARLAADPVAANPAGADSVIYPRGTAGAAAPEHTASSASVATLVVGALLGTGGLWLLWRSRRELKVVGARGKLTIAETRSLGSKQYLVVASYGDQKFLLGVCPGKIDMLTPLGDEGKRAL